MNTVANYFISEFYNVLIRQNKTYRQIDCFNLCLQRNIIKTCGCYYTRYFNLNENIEPCLNVIQYDCVMNETRQLRSSTYKHSCSTECPLECDSVSYDLNWSSLDYPSRDYFNLIKKVENLNVTYEMYKKNYIALKVFYPYTQYTLISQTPKATPVDLIASVGGALGVFLGLSIFSLLEVVEIVCLIIGALFRAKKF